jgi:hypothetical protein
VLQTVVGCSAQDQSAKAVPTHLIMMVAAAQIHLVNTKSESGSYIAFTNLMKKELVLH